MGDIDSDVVNVDVLRAEKDDEGVITADRGKCSANDGILVCWYCCCCREPSAPLFVASVNAPCASRRGLSE
jgi:hypothetical protein